MGHTVQCVLNCNVFFFFFSFVCIVSCTYEGSHITLVFPSQNINYSLFSALLLKRLHVVLPKSWKCREFRMAAALCLGLDATLCYLHPFWSHSSSILITLQLFGHASLYQPHRRTLQEHWLAHRAIHLMKAGNIWVTKWAWLHPLLVICNSWPTPALA